MIFRLKWVGGASILLLLVFFIYFILPKPASYEGLPISGIVIDQESGVPLEGVVVLAVWGKTGGFFHTYRVGNVAVQRTVTSKSGEFYLPGWPEYQRTLGSLIAGEHIRFDQPYLYFLRANYIPKKISNHYPKKENDGSAQKKIKWNRGSKFVLESAKGTDREKYQVVIENMYVPIDVFVPNVTYCGDFEQFKSAFVQIDKQEYQAEIKGVSNYSPNSWLSHPLYNLNSPDRCVQIMEWLKEQRKEQELFYESF